MRSIPSFPASALTLMLISNPATAQAQDTNTEAALEVEAADIVVTANKREQRLNDVGFTVQAATSDTLDERGVADVADLAKIVPGFTATQSLYATPVYTLRGIGLYDSTFGGAPSVAIYTDETPRNVPVMSAALGLDLERVEVLKGPQGTTFGQSATGGAINYIVGKPTDTLELGGTVSYERFGLLGANGYVSGPITGTLSGRLAVGVKRGGAWQYSLSRPGDELGDQNILEGRASLLWQPTDRLRVYASATGQRDRSDPLASQYQFSQFNIYSAAALAVANANPATANPFAVVDEARYADLTSPTGAAFDPSFLGRQNTLVRRLNGASVDPSNPSLAEQNRLILASPVANRARQADWTPGFLRRNDNSYWQFSGRIDFDLTDEIKLTTLTSLARSKIGYTADLDATAAPNIDVLGAGSVRSFNQEIRLQGDMERLRWLVGASYDNVRSVQEYQYDLTAYSGNVVFPGLILRSSASSYSGRQLTNGFFANLEYDVADRFTILAGARYTKNKLRAGQCYFDPASDTSQATSATFELLSDVLRGQPFGTTSIGPNQCFVLGDGTGGTTVNAPTIVPFISSLSEDNISFRVGANYKFDSGSLIYVTLSQGYKAGLFSAVSPSTVDQYDPATQEKVIAYEAGFKIPVIPGKLRFNGAGFYYDYSDKQIRARVRDDVFGLLEKGLNVPKSYIWGIEGELQSTPVDGLNITASATYLKSKVTGDFSTTADGRAIYNNQGYTGNFRGSSLPFTPKFSATADAQYEWEMGRIRPFVGASINYMGSVNATFENGILRADLFDIGSYETVGVRAGFGSTDGNWRVMFYGRNIFDKYYVVAKSNLLDTFFQTAGRPAIYGVSISVNY